MFFLDSDPIAIRLELRQSIMFPNQSTYHNISIDGMFGYILGA